MEHESPMLAKSIHLKDLKSCCLWNYDRGQSTAMISAVQVLSSAGGKRLRMEVAVVAHGKALSGKEVIMLSG